MNAQERKNALEQLVATRQPVRTGIPIVYHGERKAFDAYQIPLDYLTYNPYNGRIGSLVKSYERQSHVLDANEPNDVKKIESFLMESKPDANKKTRQSLLDDHQRVHGIVTADGIIIDGNRRACLLNSIRHDDSIAPNQKQHCEYFVAIILPIDADKKEILRLETSFQMGEDAKVDYNPIEKYLKCQDLKDEGFTDREIAQLMGDSETNIKMYLRVLTLMNEYLETYGYSGIYTLLDKNEDSFQKLDQALKAYDAGGVPNMWDYDPQIDVPTLKLIAFDYIRSGFDQTDFRDIIKKPTSANKSSSFFASKDIWEGFRDRHFSVTDGINEEPVEDLIENVPTGDITRKLKARDNAWKKQVQGVLQDNYASNKDRLNNKQAADNPIKLLQKALEALKSVDITQASFKQNRDVADCLEKIKNLIAEYQELLNNE
ncbi:MAG: hypothetical protein FWD58_05835 [Firmicutes bacterium]|nr:hypothetical protein [Bacillota bacterium]